MNNEQILENWNLQFKDQKKLNIEELIDRAIEKVEIISSLNEEKHTDLL